MATLQSPESSAPARTGRKPSNIAPGKKAPSKAIEERTPEETKIALQRYARGNSIAVRTVKDRKLRSNLKKLEHRYKDAALKAKDAEMLLVEEKGYVEAEGMERTFKLSQADLRKAVDVATAQKVPLPKFPLFSAPAQPLTRGGFC